MVQFVRYQGTIVGPLILATTYELADGLMIL